MILEISDSEAGLKVFRTLLLILGIFLTIIRIVTRACCISRNYYTHVFVLGK